MGWGVTFPRDSIIINLEDYVRKKKSYSENQACGAAAAGNGLLEISIVLNCPGPRLKSFPFVMLERFQQHSL